MKIDKTKTELENIAKLLNKNDPQKIIDNCNIEVVDLETDTNYWEFIDKDIDYLNTNLPNNKKVILTPKEGSGYTGTFEYEFRSLNLGLHYNSLANKPKYRGSPYDQEVEEDEWGVRPLSQDFLNFLKTEVLPTTLNPDESIEITNNDGLMFSAKPESYCFVHNLSIPSINDLLFGPEDVEFSCDLTGTECMGYKLTPWEVTDSNHNNLLGEQEFDYADDALNAWIAENNPDPVPTLEDATKEEDEDNNPLRYIISEEVIIRRYRMDCEEEILFNREREDKFFELPLFNDPEIDKEGYSFIANEDFCKTCNVVVAVESDKLIVAKKQLACESISGPPGA